MELSSISMISSLLVLGEGPLEVIGGSVEAFRQSRSKSENEKV